jgi:hypothetical protein
MSQQKLPEGDRIGIVDHAIRVRVTISHEEFRNNVDEECQLASYIQEEEFLWEPSEEGEFKRREKRAVHRPT